MLFNALHASFELCSFFGIEQPSVSLIIIGGREFLPPFLDKGGESELSKHAGSLGERTALHCISYAERLTLDRPIRLHPPRAA